MCSLVSSAVILSVEELIEELPDITETDRLCDSCFKLGHNTCKTIHMERQRQPGLTWSLKADIATAWYDKSFERRWEEVVSALICIGKVRQAYDLATKKGVDIGPLLSSN